MALCVAAPSWAAATLLGLYHGHSYYLIPADTWSHSSAAAVSLGASLGVNSYLVTINDAAEENFIHNACVPVSGFAWIGMYFTSPTGSGKPTVPHWQNGDPVAYANFCAGEPSHTFWPPPTYQCGYEDVVGINVCNSWTWNDFCHDNTWPGIVEVETDQRFPPPYEVRNYSLREMFPDQLSGKTLTCPPTTGSAGPLAKLDGCGNTFLLSCETDFFCLRYLSSLHPQGEMVSRCPWLPASNTWTFKFVVPQDTPPKVSIPTMFLGSVHISENQRAAPPYVFPGMADFCDGDPSTPNEIDWVTQRFAVSRDLTEIFHSHAPLGRQDLPQNQQGFLDGVVQPLAVCQELQPGWYPENPQCEGPSNLLATGRPVAAAAGESMGEAENGFTVSGSAAGGLVTFGIGDRSFTTTTYPGETAAAVAESLAAVASAPNASLPEPARASGSSVLVLGEQRERFWLTSADAGITQPMAPTGVTLDSTGHTCVLRWSNHDQYDAIAVLSAGGAVSPFLVGSTTSFADTSGCGLPQGYKVVGWKNGTPSAPAVATYATTDVAPSPGKFSGRGSLSVGRPNPTSGGVSFTLSLASNAAIDVRVHDVTGRTVALLATGVYPVGNHDIVWNGRTSNGAKAPAGVYFVVAKVLGETRSSRVVLMK